MIVEPWAWVVAALCAVIIGIAKTGVPGLGILVVPLLMIASGGDGKQSTGLLLPLLCFADCFAVAYFRRHARWDRIWRLMPWVGIGVLAGWITLRNAGDAVLNPLIGAIVLAMIIVHLMRKRVPDTEVPRSWLAALVFGAIAGFATTVSNSAGPVMNLYLLSMALPKQEFMGTGAWYFFIINLAKVPLFASEGMITQESLFIDAVLVPGVIVGALFGRRLFEFVPQRAFETVVLVLTTVATLSLIVPWKQWMPHAGDAPVELRQPAASPAGAPQEPEDQAGPATTTP